MACSLHYLCGYAGNDVPHLTCYSRMVMHHPLFTDMALVCDCRSPVPSPTDTVGWRRQRHSLSLVRRRCWEDGAVVSVSVDSSHTRLASPQSLPQHIQ